MQPTEVTSPRVMQSAGGGKMLENEMIERWKTIFQNHEAKIQEVDENTQILTWKKKDTIIYSLEFIFRDNRIYVGGDLGWGTFNTTWQPRWDYDWYTIQPGYFAGKCTSIKNGRYLWDKEYALENLKDEYRYMMEDPNYYETLYDEILNAADDIWMDWEDVDSEIADKYDIDTFFIKQMWCAIRAIKSSSSREEYIYNLNSDPHFDDYNDFWEWGYGVGDMLNGYFSIWIIALRMAREQLIEKGYGDKYEK